MLEDGGHSLGPVRASGFHGAAPPTLEKRSGIGIRLAAGHAVALDDPMAVGRFAVEEIELWRDAGLYYFVPCVAKEKMIAVLALGRKTAGAHLSSEDMALLAAVAGQMATALENARLYRQLQVKAIEFDRLRTFNENILESLDAGLLVFNEQEQRAAVEYRARAAVRRHEGRSHRPDARRSVRRPVRRGDPRGASRGPGRRDVLTLPAGGERRAHRIDADRSMRPQSRCARLMPRRSVAPARSSLSRT